MAEVQALTNDEAVDTPAVEADVSRETPDPAEEKARKFGWKPKEEFLEAGGKESAWSPPDAFLEVKERSSKERIKEIKRLERALEAERENNKKNDGRIAALEKALAQQNQARGEIHESSLMSARRQAAEAGDWTAFEQYDKQLRELDKAIAALAPTAAAAGNAQPDAYTKAILEDFGEEHPEYQRPDMQRILGITFKELMAVDPNMPLAEALNEAHELSRRRYSDKYVTNGTQKRTPMAETGGTPAKSDNGVKMWSDLKPDVRQKYEKDIFTAPTYSGMKPAQLEAAKARIVKDLGPEFFKGAR